MCVLQAALTATPGDKLIVHSWPNKIFHTQQNRVSEIQRAGVGDEISEVTLDMDQHTHTQCISEHTLTYCAKEKPIRELELAPELKGVTQSMSL